MFEFSKPNKQAAMDYYFDAKEKSYQKSVKISVTLDIFHPKVRSLSININETTTVSKTGAGESDSDNSLWGRVNWIEFENVELQLLS